ncbi:hypothetical protein BKA65DRAFT_165403 [Rhexocercosporidium sp. MPI-PUGE-AT-0058]|nr:hypothetical protein BKA65DRAFT_165403 [Rhexocercosporidium sp. MPI-PUGE-AT-0058]
MASSMAAIEPLLATTMRVLREVTIAEDLIAAWPSLREKALSSPLAITDIERRLLLDLPDKDVEISNINAATNLSREQLIEKASSHCEELTSAELVVLKNRFWTPKTSKESSRHAKAMCAASAEEALREIMEVGASLSSGEDTAFQIGAREFWKRQRATNNEKRSAAAEIALLSAKDWIQHVYREGKSAWGFVCLYDAASQRLDPARLDDFRSELGGFFRDALNYNGSKDIIDTKWQRLSFNAPETGFAPPADEHPMKDLSNYQGGTVLRKAFHEIMADPQEYQKREDVSTPCWGETVRQDINIAESGFLTNTFLVIDPVCIELVLSRRPWYDELRVLAFEADFPVKGREYVEGYQGFTWVRLDQLVYNFYELRLLRAEEIKMDQIWKVAQESRNQAFVSMDPGESFFTLSRRMGGFTRDSVLGKDWYAARDAKQE